MHCYPTAANTALIDLAPGLRELPLLSAGECQHWSTVVLTQRSRWTSRSPHVPFFTLGLAAYLDAVDAVAELQNKSLYQAVPLRRMNNRLLAQHFSGLLETVRSALASALALAVRYDTINTALPGFHIHLPHAAFAQAVASQHCDLQFERVFPTRTLAANAVMTFTLALSVPPGSGLCRWLEAGAQVTPYRAGSLYLHSGLDPHQAILHPQASNTPRITLQGHGACVNDEWILYW